MTWLWSHFRHRDYESLHVRRTIGTRENSAERLVRDTRGSQRLAPLVGDCGQPAELVTVEEELSRYYRDEQGYIHLLW